MKKVRNIRWHTVLIDTVTTKISQSTFSHPCSKFLATAKVDLANYDSFRGGGSQILSKS